MEFLDRKQRLRLAERVVLSLSMVACTVMGQSVDEYELKAAFLYNFTKFVEWPSVPNPDAFNICILGDDPFGETLDQLVKGKTAYSRKIRVLRLKEPAEARQCPIVFVRDEESTKAAKLIEAVRGAPVLTVSESRKFLNSGGMVALSMKEGHVSLGINLHHAESAGLKVSAKLMSLVRNESEEP
jgi:hypothetical protein